MKLMGGVLKVVKGFYNLSSAMLTQTRNLDVIGNNMTNVTTNGYKSDRYVDSTFESYITSRVGNKIKNPVEIGSMSYKTIIDDVVTVHTQGAIEHTGLSLDFAITGDGYFSIQTEQGNAYTRNGSFMIDEEGYLYLNEQGRVLGANGQPLYLGTDKISADASGFITNETGQVLGQIGVFSFENPREQLTKGNGVLFTANVQPQLSQDFTIHHKSVEKANMDMIREMTDMIVCQKAFQSASQVTKMYDSMLTKATEIGRV